MRALGIAHDDLLDRLRNSWLLFLQALAVKQSLYGTSAHSARKFFPQHFALLRFVLTPNSHSRATALWR